MVCRRLGDRPHASPEPTELHRCRTHAPVHAGHEVGTPFDGHRNLAGGRRRNTMDIPTESLVPLIVGSVVLAMFLPTHIAIWSRFPVWYHLTFLLTIIPAVLVGTPLPPCRNKDVKEVYPARR